MALYPRKFLQGAGNQNSPETMDLRQQDEASKTPRLLHGFHQDHYLRNEKFMDLDELKYVFGATEGAHMVNNLLMKFCVAQLHFQNEIEGSTNVAYFLRTVPAAIVAYLDYETWCTSARPITFARADRTVSLFSSLRLIGQSLVASFCYPSSAENVC